MAESLPFEEVVFESKEMRKQMETTAWELSDSSRLKMKGLEEVDRICDEVYAT